MASRPKWLKRIAGAAQLDYCDKTNAGGVLAAFASGQLSQRTGRKPMRINCKPIIS